MDKKGEIGIGIVITTFMAIFVGVVLFLAVSQQLSVPTDILTSRDNVTYTAGADNVPIDLTGQELFSTPVVFNATNATHQLNTANYTINEGVSATTGLKTIQYTSATNSEFAGENINISTYQYGGDGYIESAGGRSIALLIPIFFALAILVVALVPTLRSSVLESMKR